jgi:hypothetical protein
MPVLYARSGGQNALAMAAALVSPNALIAAFSVRLQRALTRLICASVEHELFMVGAVQSRLIWVPEMSAGKEIGLPAKEG